MATGWEDVLARRTRDVAQGLSSCPGISRACQRFPGRGAGDMWPQANPCWSLCRPHGKSYLYFTQFKAEVQGAEIEYGMAYVSTGCVGVRALGDRKDGDRDTEHLVGEFGRTWGTAQTPRPGSAGGQGYAHRGAGSRHPCVPVQPPASHLLGEPALSQRAGAWVLGPGTATGAAGQQWLAGVCGGPQPRLRGPGVHRPGSAFCHAPDPPRQPPARGWWRRLQAHQVACHTVKPITLQGPLLI